MLLHLDMDFLRLLLVLVDNFGQSAVVRLLFLLLLALGSVRYTDLAVIIDLLLQIFRLCVHFLGLVVDARA